jgi:hypothetical protein
MKITKQQKEKYFKNVYDNIKKFGFHSTSVLEEKDFTPFSYSTGIYKNFRIPEIIISGLGPNFSTELINNYVNQYKFKEIPINTKINNLTEKFPVYLIPIKTENLNDYVLSTIKYYGNDDFEYIQLIFPDLALKFPHETDYDYDQEIFGEFEPE